MIDFYTPDAMPDTTGSFLNIEESIPVIGYLKLEGGLKPVMVKAFKSSTVIEWQDNRGYGVTHLLYLWCYFPKAPTELFIKNS